MVGGDKHHLAVTGRRYPSLLPDLSVGMLRFRLPTFVQLPAHIQVWENGG